MHELYELAYFPAGWEYSNEYIHTYRAISRASDSPPCISAALSPNEYLFWKTQKKAVGAWLWKQQFDDVCMSMGNVCMYVSGHLQGMIPRTIPDDSLPN